MKGSFKRSLLKATNIILKHDINMYKYSLVLIIKIDKKRPTTAKKVGRSVREGGAEIILFLSVLVR